MKIRWESTDLPKPHGAGFTLEPGEAGKLKTQHEAVEHTRGATCECTAWRGYISTQTIVKLEAKMQARQERTRKRLAAEGLRLQSTEQDPDGSMWEVWE